MFNLSSSSSSNDFRGGLFLNSEGLLLTTVSSRPTVFNVSSSLSATTSTIARQTLNLAGTSFARDRFPAFAYNPSLTNSNGQTTDASYIVFSDAATSGPANSSAIIASKLNGLFTPFFTSINDTFLGSPAVGTANDIFVLYSGPSGPTVLDMKSSYASGVLGTGSFMTFTSPGLSTGCSTNALPMSLSPLEDAVLIPCSNGLGRVVAVVPNIFSLRLFG
jgi:hypothetical protein